jgi:hypothetical protein
VLHAARKWFFKKKELVRLVCLIISIQVISSTKKPEYHTVYINIWWLCLHAFPIKKEQNISVFVTHLCSQHEWRHLRSLYTPDIKPQRYSESNILCLYIQKHCKMKKCSTISMCLVYHNWNNTISYKVAVGHSVAQLVEALRYKPEGRKFDSRWCH